MASAPASLAVLAMLPSLASSDVPVREIAPTPTGLAAAPDIILRRGLELAEACLGAELRKKLREKSSAFARHASNSPDSSSSWLPLHINSIWRPLCICTFGAAATSAE